MSYIQWMDEDIPGRKRAKVMYECRTASGERKRKSKTFKVGTPLREIKAFQRKVEQEYETSEGVDYTKRTLKDFLKEYFDMYGHFLSPATLRNYQQMAFSRPHGIAVNLGKTELLKLSTAMVQRYIDYLMEEGLSAKTIKNYAGMYKVIIKYVQKILNKNVQVL